MRRKLSRGGDADETQVGDRPPCRTRSRTPDDKVVVVVGGQACQSADRGWRRVVVDGDGGGRGRVASNVPRGRRQHVRAVRCLSGIPGHGIGCRRDLRPKGVAVERELNACHPDVVRGCGGHHDRGTRYRGSVQWSGKRHDRRRRIGQRHEAAQRRATLPAASFEFTS